MTFDLEKILESKRRFRQQLAARPIEEKLAMLDALRERSLAIRAAQPILKAGALHQQPPSYRVPGKKSG